MQSPQAIHLTGGNLFHDMRIDIVRSIEIQEEWLETVPKQPVYGNKIHNTAHLLLVRLLKKGKIYEPLINIGLIGAWFRQFEAYWGNVLRGRPITVMDFHQLCFLLRTRAQYTRQLSWETNAEHLAHWQTHEKIYTTFSYTLRQAYNPITSYQLLSLLQNDMRILEYGCSLAPMYSSWRTFASHIPTTWVLADIANFPFHYARHLYACDQSATFCLISEDLFDDPLRHVAGLFDIIIVKEVFEHLHKPRHIAAYLLDRLKPGGYFYFDYIYSEARGLDTPMGLNQRTETLKYLQEHVTFLHGDFRVDNHSLGPCIGRKK